MVEAVIMLLIYICLVVGACFVIWVLGHLGVALPAQIVKIFWVVVVLIVILLLWRVLAPALGGGGFSLR